ncbi:heavy metal translocating P-type ATPase [Treponema saccharophilum]|uniref:P-type Zn(2+) transporter n=1 Tax=Treponema saccharophilum DSM 2985 TaxID=907348 RepID=H7EPU3_9SPIR|nr:heavy metal translocating P-type ATPase [Treponema saccharophilum]EIC00494.1 heavy metal translocating P-type ATPase [Treponema saccharophilum DSM 2985]BDC95029.1 ATPase P [Treponema saccharophilum]
MTVTIHHALPGRLRVHYDIREITPRQAILAQSLIAVQEGITDISVNTNIGSYLILFDSSIISQAEIKNLFKALGPKYLDDEKLLEAVSQIPITESITSIFIGTMINHFAKKLLPLPLRKLLLFMNIVPRVGSALGMCFRHGNIFSTQMLDATALTTAAFTGNTNTASSISMLLNLGEQIEEVTKRVSYGNLAHKLLISDEPVHILENGEEKTIPADALKKDDLVIVREGSMIPCDGTVERGEGMVNQASITGESLPVDKKAGSGVFAGTILSEGELVIRTRTTGRDTKVHNIIKMIDNSQNLKANAQRRSENLAEKIVPLNFALAGITWLFTRNLTKTMSTLMVDYSCAMKLAAPIAVLSAMKEAAGLGISVKGGKYLEEAAEATTIIFDKTGTLTFANPKVEKIHAMKEYGEDFVLQTAACLEEHFPHPLGRAVVSLAEERGLLHPENHTKVEYIVAHGIASTLDGKKVRIGSAHFIFDDEKIPFDEKVRDIQEESAKNGESLLYLSYDGELAGVLTIGDPVRPEAREVVQNLRKTGIKRCVMITGDTEGAAKKIAESAGLDGYYSQALPEDKVSLIKKEKAGGKVIMLGDGINDAPALSAADVGIAIEGSSSIASDTADIVLSEGGLSSVAATRILAQGLIRKISANNAFIIEVNSALLLLGVFGLISPQLAAILHNSVTVGISVKSMQPILKIQ